jgi:hypothetical protein
MWKIIALAVAALAPAAAPGAVQVVLHGILQTTSAPVQAAPARTADQVPESGKSFAPTCRGDQVLDSRPDPAWVGRSFAGDRCRSPALPPAIDGMRATRGQVVAAMAAAKRYEAAADGFARCVSDFVAARRAGTAHPLSQAQLVIENHRVLVAQRAMQRAQAQVNWAINAFNEYGSECPDHG